MRSFWISSMIDGAGVLWSSKGGDSPRRSLRATMTFSTLYEALFPSSSKGDHLRNSTISLVGWFPTFMEYDESGKWSDSSNFSHESIVSLARGDSKILMSIVWD